MALVVSLPEPVMKHSYGVAEFMAKYAIHHPALKLDPYEMYTIGLLHDIGKLYPGDFDPTGKAKYKGHAQKGGNLLYDLGFTCYKEVMHHGHPEHGYYSRKWLILNLADLSVNSEGKTVRIEDRIAKIKDRYGENSEEYRNAQKMYWILVNENMV